MTDKSCCINCRRILMFKDAELCTLDGKPIPSRDGYCVKYEAKITKKETRNPRIETLL